MAKAVIMAGGQGERFWPMTHAAFPKYRIRFEKNQSLLGGTWLRLCELFKPSDIYVVTTKDHVRFIRAELPQLKAANMLVEPRRNNTASALVYSTCFIEKKFGSSELVCFFPADHLIQRVDRFVDTMKRAMSAATRQDRLVTIGIKPRFPATGYGYIRRAKPLTGEKNIFEVGRFVEKPSREKAMGYLKQGQFLWNAGMFVWKTGVFRKKLATYASEYSDFSLTDVPGSYRRMPARSIDVALLEKASGIAVAATDMDWCDMGSWEMFDERSPKGENANVFTGPVVSKENNGVFVLNQTETPVVILGLQDVIVVRTEQGLLISKKTRSEEAARLAPRE